MHARFKRGAAYFESIKKTKKEVSTIPVLQKLKHLLFQYVKICLARQVGTQGPSDGHSGTKRWALRDQALGIDRTSDGHSLPMRCAQSAQMFGDFWALIKVVLSLYAS